MDLRWQVMAKWRRLCDLCRRLGTRRCRNWRRGWASTEAPQEAHPNQSLPRRRDPPRGRGGRVATTIGSGFAVPPSSGTASSSSPAPPTESEWPSSPSTPLLYGALAAREHADTVYGGLATLGARCNCYGTLSAWAHYDKLHGGLADWVHADACMVELLLGIKIVIAWCTR